MAAALDQVVHARRVRPPQLGELMANLLDPARLRATQTMSAEGLGMPQRLPEAGSGDPTPSDPPLSLEDDPREMQDTDPLETPDTEQTPLSQGPLEPATPQTVRASVAPVPKPPAKRTTLPTLPARPVHATRPAASTFSEPETVVSRRVSRGALAAVPRWMIFSTVGLVAALLVVTLLVLLIK
jgi:hypothetical protein